MLSPAGPSGTARCPASTPPRGDPVLQYPALRDPSSPAEWSPAQWAPAPWSPGRWSPGRSLSRGARSTLLATLPARRSHLKIVRRTSAASENPNHRFSIVISCFDLKQIQGHRRATVVKDAMTGNEPDAKKARPVSRAGFIVTNATAIGSLTEPRLGGPRNSRPRQPPSRRELLVIGLSPRSALFRQRSLGYETL
jgi:hypothetical protein